MKIGLFRTCGIGDAVQMTPLLRQIRADEPEADIHVFVSANAAPVLEGNPWATVHSLPLAWLGKSQGTWGLPRAWNLVRRRGPFDWFLCLEPGWRRSLGLMMVRSGEKAGFVYGKKWPGLFTKGLPVVHGQAHHNSEAMLRLWTHAAGHADRGWGYDMTWFPGGDPEATDAVPRPHVALAPGAGNFLNEGDAKKWPAGHWLRLIVLLRERGLNVVVVGLAGDFPKGASEAGAVDATGKLSLRQCARVIARAACFAGNDSGLLHLACGLGVPVVALFGPTLPVHTGPFRHSASRVLRADLECLGCGQLVCPRPAGGHGQVSKPYCMHLLEPETVAGAMDDLMAGAGSAGDVR